MSKQTASLLCSSSEEPQDHANTEAVGLIQNSLSVPHKEPQVVASASRLGGEGEAGRRRSKELAVISRSQHPRSASLALLRKHASKGAFVD